MSASAQCVNDVARLSWSWTAASNTDHYTSVVTNPAGAQQTYSHPNTTFQYALDVSEPGNYSVTVRAINGVGQQTRTATAQSPDCTPPATVTITLAAINSTCSNGNPANVLSWSSSDPSSTTYTVLRDGQQLTTTSNTTYTDTSVTAGTSYTYTVAANGVTSNQRQVTTITCQQRPEPFTLSGNSSCRTPAVSALPFILPGIGVAHAQSAGGIPVNSLSWTASAGADLYDVRRDNTVVQTVTNRGYQDADVNTDQQYQYLIRARNNVGTRDSNALSLTTTTCEPANQPPVAANDQANTSVDTPVLVSVLPNDSDPDGNLDPQSLTVTTTPSNGTATVTNQQIRYVPNAGFTGTDTLVYRVCDTEGLCDTATVTITVNEQPAEPQPPVANDDQATTTEDSPIAIDVLANDSDPDGQLNESCLQISTVPSNGTAVVGTGGRVTYTPSTGFSGTDSFVYSICDNDGLTDTATVTVTVTPGEQPPIEAPGPFSLNLQAVCAGQSPEHILTWSASERADSYTVLRNGQALTTSTQRSYVDSTPTSGTAYTYVIRATNEGGTTNSTERAVTTASCAPPPPASEPPHANDDAASTTQGSAVDIDVLANDTDPDGSIDPTCVEIIQTPANGTVTVNPQTGQVTFTPNAEFHGTDNFVYSVCDDEGLTDTATVTVTVAARPPEPTPENQPPQANDDAAETNHDQAVEIDVLANDVDPDGDLDRACLAVTRNPGHGTATVNRDTGTVTYAPNPGYAGTDSFEYAICDNEGLVDSATVTVAVGQAPPQVLAQTGSGFFDFFINLWYRFLDLLGLRS